MRLKLKLCRNLSMCFKLFSFKMLQSWKEPRLELKGSYQRKCMLVLNQASTSKAFELKPELDLKNRQKTGP